MYVCMYVCIYVCMYVCIVRDQKPQQVGAVLSQLDSKGCDRPVAYFSCKLMPREQRYSTVEQECLAIKLGVEAFKVYLIGRHFIVQTDHRSLKWLNRLKENNSRLTRWSLALQPFSFTVEHRAGTANGNADALSRCVTDMSAAGEGGRNVEDAVQQIGLLQEKEGGM